MIYQAGEEGFLFVDILVSLFILSLTAALLFSSALSLIEIRNKEEIHYENCRKAYLKILLEPIRE